MRKLVVLAFVFAFVFTFVFVFKCGKPTTDVSFMDVASETFNSLITYSFVKVVNESDNSIDFDDVKNIVGKDEHPIYIVKEFLRKHSKYKKDIEDEYYPPREFFELRYGDCEDIAAFIVFSLLDAGIDPEDLRIAMVDSNKSGLIDHVAAKYKNFIIENNGAVFVIYDSKYYSDNEIIYTLQIDEKGLVK